MSKAEDRALEHCCAKCENNKLNCGMKLLSHGRNCIKCGNYIKGYKQAEKDITDKAKTSSGWDGFYYGQGYKQAEKDLELTWEDLATIEKLGDDFDKHNQTPMSDEEFYKEVLKRFNKERKEK